MVTPKTDSSSQVGVRPKYQKKVFSCRLAEVKPHLVDAQNGLTYNEDDWDGLSIVIE